jgi:hypothetical protein
MGEVFYHDFADLDRRQRELELYEAHELAREFPDLVRVAPEMFDLLLELREMWLARGEAWEPLDELFNWLEKRT